MLVPKWYIYGTLVLGIKIGKNIGTVASIAIFEVEAR